MRPWMRMPRILVAVALAAGVAQCTPTIAFPFNSQVPQVARKNEQYNFQLSDSTFAPQDASLVYSIAQQPAWLSLDAATRTLRGTPGDGDVGSSEFTITAADQTGSAHMQCTLIVASDPPPKLQGDFTQQLAAAINLTSNDPATVALTPGTRFAINFRRDSFIDIVQRKLYYYATLTDHTPLPSWLLFDSDALSFSGVAPQLSAFPQAFSISLIASDYAGFSGASASFTVVIATQQLTIVPSRQTIRFSPGTALKLDTLKDSVYINGGKVSTSDLQSATANLPSWLHFDSSSLDITGTPSSDAKAQNGSVTIVDKQGNTAQVSLEFIRQDSSLFSGDFGTITATPGQTLVYTIPTSAINGADVSLDIVKPTGADWLTLDNQARILGGVVPQTLSPTKITATLDAKASAVTGTQTQSIVIDIESTLLSLASSSASGSSSATSSTSNEGATMLAGYSDDTQPHLAGGIIAAIVVCSIIGAVLLLALVAFCCRRRRREGGYVRQTPSPTRPNISGPMPEKQAESILVTTQMQRDVEKNAAAAAERDSFDEDRPPQIALEIPASTTRLGKWGQRTSGMSQASSIGNGEEAIMRDNNIPEWGQASTALHKPHDSFTIPVEMAKGRKHTRSISPAKRMMRRLTADKRQSKQSIGLGIDTGESSAVILPAKTRRSKRFKNAAQGHTATGTRDRSSCASFSTQATSLLSTRPSDFPRPPTQSTVAGSRLTLSASGPDKRRSIRFIRRSDSVDDQRPIEQKRESFIRNRASASVQSPLFSHGSRIPSDTRAAARTSSSEIGSSILNRGRSSRLTGTASKSSYSQSSSRDNGIGEERRLSQRIRSAFAPNFPRVISRPDLDVYEDEREAIEDDLDENWEDVTPLNSRTNSAADMRKFAAEMAKPRQLRSWVLPGEASPTPPPLTPGSQAQSARRATPASESSVRQRWRERVTRSDRSSSPLTNVVQSIESPDEGRPRPGKAPKIPSKSPHRRYSHLNEPLGLVAKDSLSRVKGAERPRLVQTKSSRPQSVEKVQRLSSLKAEPEDDTQAGSEDVAAELQGTGLTGPAPESNVKTGTQGSLASGKAFL